MYKYSTYICFANLASHGKLTLISDPLFIYISLVQYIERIVKSWWLSGCHSSVTRALVGEVSGPGFDSQWLPAFFTFFFQSYQFSVYFELRLSVKEWLKVQFLYFPSVFAIWYSNMKYMDIIRIYDDIWYVIIP